MEYDNPSINITPVSIKQLEHGYGLPLPKNATTYSAGMDLYAANIDDIVISPKSSWEIIPTGFCIALPPGKEAQIRPRSGLALKHGITVLNSPGTIDADYRGEVKVILINHHQTEPFVVTRGMRIAQMVVAEYKTVCFIPTDDLDTTERGKGGFGSTNYKFPV